MAAQGARGAAASRAIHSRSGRLAVVAPAPETAPLAIRRAKVRAGAEPGYALGMDAIGDNRSENPQQNANGLPARVADVVGEVSASAEKPSQSRPAALVARQALARITRRGAHFAGRGVRSGIRRLTAEVIAMAPRLPVRDQAALRAQFPGRSPEDVADALIEGASRASAAVGATIGVWSVLPIAPAFPAEIVTETLTLVGIEIKLVAELHEVYGMRPAGDFASRMTAYVGAWARRRGVALAPGGGGVALAIGSPLGRQLQRRLAVRATRSAISLGPLLTGAAAGALINRRETRRLGNDVREHLRRSSPATTHWSA
jgi:hypothetical protein